MIKHVIFVVNNLSNPLDYSRRQVLYANWLLYNCSEYSIQEFGLDLFAEN